MDGYLSSTVLDHTIGLALPNGISLRRLLLFSMVRIYRHYDQICEGIGTVETGLI